MLEKPSPNHPHRWNKRFFGAAACFVTAAALLLWAGLPQRADFYTPTSAQSDTAPEVGYHAPLFNLKTVNGDAISLADFNGHVVLVNFWATWCEPCKLEMPILQDLYQEFHPRGLMIFAVNIGESADAVRRWAVDYALTFPLLLDEHLSTIQVYELRGQPMTFIIQTDGIIREVIYGASSRTALESALAQLLPA